MKRMIKFKMTNGIDNVNVNTDEKYCESCIMSKHARSTFPKNKSVRSSRILELIKFVVQYQNPLGMVQDIL